MAEQNPLRNSTPQPADLPPGYRFVPLNSVEGQSIAATMQTSELTAQDRNELKTLRESYDRIREGFSIIESAEDALSRIDEGPVSGRIGGLFAEIGLGASVPDYEMIDALKGRLGNVELRKVGGSDTEKEFERAVKQNIDYRRTPEYNAAIIAETRRLHDLALAELNLAEGWVNLYGSFTARNRQGQTFSQARSALVDRSRRQRNATREFTRGGWLIEEITPQGQ